MPPEAEAWLGAWLRRVGASVQESVRPAPYEVRKPLGECELGWDTKCFAFWVRLVQRRVAVLSLSAA